MGLISWYPLNGDLKDRGLLGYDLTNSNSSVITVSDSGKIGKCYEDLTTSYAYLEAAQPILLNQTHSMFCWVCPEVLTTSSNLDAVLGNHIFTDSNPSNTGITLKRVTDTTYKVSLNTANTSNSRTYITYCGNTTLTINEWHHIGFTYDGKRIRIYVDGKVDGEVDYTNMKFSSQKIRIFSWSNVYTQTTYTGKKKINDVRIYDHCLSTAEVKQIAQACVLHYNFEDVIVPYENQRYNQAIVGYNNYSGKGLDLTITKLDETFEGGDIYRMVMKATIDTVLTSVQDTLHSHGVMTDRNSSKTTFDPNIPVSHGILFRRVSHNDIIVGGTAANRFSAVDLGNEHYKDNWYKSRQYRINYTTTAETDAFFVSVRCPSAKLNEEVIVDFCCQEEYVGIDFLPERQFYQKDLDYEIIDGSGYGHNGNLMVDNKIKFVKDTIEGNYCAQFFDNDGGCFISTPNIFTDNVNQCHTVCAWVKKTSDTQGNQQLVNWNLGYRLQHSETQKTGLMYINSGANDCYCYHKALTLNQWEHVAYVMDRNKNIRIVYINGVKSNTTTTGTSSSALTPAGFGDKTRFGVGFNGYLDDIRVYATALSAADIKQIYETKAKIDKDGKVFINNFNEETIFDKDNLIYNGMLELESTSGFYTSTAGALSYDTTDSFRGSKGCLKSTDLTILSDKLIPINSTDRYKFEFDLKFEGTPDATHYLSLLPFDQKKGHIDIDAVQHYEETETTLAQAISNGDTQVYLTDGTNWRTASSAAYMRRIGLFNLPEAPNYERARAYKAYDSIEGNVVTLSSAWTGGAVSAGEKVANCYSGGVEWYFRNGIAPAYANQEWEHHEYYIQGTIRPFTCYVRFGIIWAEKIAEGKCMKITNIKMTNLTSPQTIVDTLGKERQDVDKIYAIKSNEFCESSMPIRYIRDYCGLSSKNTYAHWNEIQAFNQVGNNIALGKSSTTTTSSYFGSTTNFYKITNGVLTDHVGTVALTDTDVASVTVDLGFIENINKVVVRHYYQDGRTYTNTKTEVSADGVNWYTIFDSALEGTYQETSSGHIIYLNPQKFSINKTGKTYLNELIES